MENPLSELLGKVFANLNLQPQHSFHLVYGTAETKQRKYAKIKGFSIYSNNAKIHI